MEMDVSWTLWSRTNNCSRYNSGWHDWKSRSGWTVSPSQHPRLHSMDPKNSSSSNNNNNTITLKSVLDMFDHNSSRRRLHVSLPLSEGCRRIKCHPRCPRDVDESMRDRGVKWKIIVRHHANSHSFSFGFVERQKSHFQDATGWEETGAKDQQEEKRRQWAACGKQPTSAFQCCNLKFGFRQSPIGCVSRTQRRVAAAREYYDASESPRI